MTDKGLVIFRTVADCTSNSEAARILNISQPTVSRALSRLEDELGTKLLNRDSFPLELTPHGMILKNMIDEDMGTKERFKRYISDQSIRQIKVGTSFPAVCDYISDKLDKLKRDEPGIKILTYSGDNIGIRNMLALRQLDVAVLPDRINCSDYLITKVIADYEWGVIAPEGVPVSDKLFVEREDLNSLPLLIPVESSSNHAVCYWLGDSDRVHHSDTYNSVETLVDLMRRGYGAGFAPMALSSYLQLKNFSFYICYPRIVTTVYIYSRKDYESSEVLNTLLALINDALK